MGVLGKMLAKQVAKGATKVAVKGATKVVKNTVMAASLGTAIYIDNTRSIKSLVKKSSHNHILVVKNKGMMFKRGYTVCDESNNVKYTVKSDAFSLGYRSVHLYNKDGREIGKVKRRKSLGCASYSLFRNDLEIGRLNRKLSAKLKFDLSYNDWVVDGNFLKNTFSVKDKKGNIVMNLNAANSARDSYVLEMNDNKNEIIGLLIIMAIDIAIHDYK